MAETLIMIKDGKPVEVNRGDVDSAMQAGLEPAAEFITPDNKKTVVRQRDFDSAFQSGLKPADHKEMGMWEAFKTGFSAGIQPTAELAAGMTGFPFAAAESTPQEELERSQAWEEQPFAYGAGKAIPQIGLAAAGGLAARGTYKAAGAVSQKAGTYAKPSWEAAKEGYVTTKQSPYIPDFPLAGASAGVVGAVKGAIKQVPETRREAAALEKLEAPTRTREAGAVGSQGVRTYLGQEILEPGMTPEKRAMAERAATMAPSNIRVDPLAEAFAMGTTRRQQARSFYPEAAAEEITPSLKKTFDYLKRGKGEAYGKLHEQAQQEYDPESGFDIPSRLKARIEGLKGTPKTEEAAAKPPVKGITGPTISTLEAAHQIIEEGPSPYGLQTGAFLEAEPAEQYRRFKVAREFIRDQIKQASKVTDPNVSNRASVAQLKEALAELDTVMKAIPSQEKADTLYKESMKAKEAFYDAMQFGKGEKRSIDVPTVKKLFGNNDRAYRLQEGIETMRKFLDKYGDDIVPAKRQEMQAVVDKFDSLRKQAEDKRLLLGLQGQGPTSPAIERTAALRQAKGLPSDIFTSPATALNAADEFMAQRSQAYFGKNFESVPQQDKNKLIRLLVWRQQNPNATMSDEESMFKKILKGK